MVEGSREFLEPVAPPWFLGRLEVGVTFVEALGVVGWCTWAFVTILAFIMGVGMFLEWVDGED